METYKQIDGYPWYEISDHGNVRRIINHKQRRFSKRKHGYLNVVLCREGAKPKGYYVHRLVAKAFVPNPNSLPEVDHIDGNPSNNKACNLQWVTHSHNLALAAQRRGKHWCAGVSSPNTKQKIVGMSDSGESIEFDSIADAARHFNSKYSTFASMMCKAISKAWLCRGYRWRRP